LITKELFSYGVSSKNNYWFDIIQESDVAKHIDNKMTLEKINNNLDTN
tara:strand:+ start:359 stop:502 length:144 start_codon:yes stop_codon:yes gene_type:complete